MRTDTVTLKKDVRLIATPVAVQTEEWSPATLTSAPIPRQMELPVAAVMSPGSSLWKQILSQHQLVLSSAQYPMPNPPVFWEILQCWGFHFRELTCTQKLWISCIIPNNLVVCAQNSTRGTDRLCCLLFFAELWQHTMFRHQGYFSKGTPDRRGKA